MSIADPQNKKQLHLAGIVPVAGAQSSYGFPWPDCMQPISDNYLAIERSIEECAYIGCKTIWVVINDDEKPILRHRVGDSATDPATLRRSAYVNYPTEHYRDIPIFYIPIHPKDRDRRDSHGWSVLHGALTAFLVGQKISKWVTPSKYYVSFPQGVYDPSVLSSLRGHAQGDSNVFLTHKGKSIVDGVPLGFTMNAEDYKRYVRDVKEQCTGGSRNTPVEKRWSSRHCELDKIFRSAIMEGSHQHEINNYNRIDNWEDLVTLYRSEYVSSLSRNGGILKKGLK